MRSIPVFFWRTGNAYHTSSSKGNLARQPQHLQKDKATDGERASASRQQASRQQPGSFPPLRGIPSQRLLHQRNTEQFPIIKPGRKNCRVWPHVSRAQAVQRGRPWATLAGNSTGREECLAGDGGEGGEGRSRGAWSVAARSCQWFSPGED